MWDTRPCSPKAVAGTPRPRIANIKRTRHAAGWASQAIASNRAAPTSPDQRLKAITAACKGFVYAVSRTGITGAQKQLAGDAQALVKRIRKFTKLPIAVGFGISNAQQFAEVGQFADAVVVGSAIVQLVEQNPGREAHAVGDFVRSLKAGVKGKGASQS